MQGLKLESRRLSRIEGWASAEMLIKRKECTYMSLIATIFLLILVNFFVAFARQQKKGWLRILLFILAVVTLLLAVLFGIRALSA